MPDESRGFMDWDLFTHIADELAPYLFSVYLWGYGEPFMHPRIYDMIRYYSKRTVNVHLSTNGQFLNKAEKAEEFVSANPRSLKLSIAGASQDTHSYYCKGSILEKVFNSIDNINNAKQKLKKTKPTLIIQYILMEHNIHEVPLIKKYASERNVVLRLKAASVGANTVYKVPKNTRITRYHSHNGQLVPKKKPRKVCVYPWTEPTILWDGRVLPCCKVSYINSPLSHIDKNISFREIWLSENFKTFRNTHLNNRNVLEKCIKCALPVAKIYK
jgi:radical SAM protein with 4Fe4S-binding SPASM domain